MLKHNIRKSIVCIVLVMILGLCSLSPAFADDVYYQGSLYNHGSFSFTDNTLTSMRLVMGQYIAVKIDFHKPDWDAGWGDINLTFQIRDADTGSVIFQDVLGPAGSNIVGDEYYWIDLGYSGRYIRFWLDASSAGASNGNFRSATIDTFRVYVYL